MSGRWLLQERLATRRLGKPIYFAVMTGMGPMTTTDPEEAASWPDEDSARRGTPNFPLTFFDPVEAPASEPVPQGEGEA